MNQPRKRYHKQNQNSSDICKNFHKNNQYSLDAYCSLGATLTGELRTKVYEYVESRKEVGATCEEIETALDISHQTASARCSELKKKGLIIPQGSRPTESGRSAAVYKTIHFLTREAA